MSEPSPEVAGITFQILHIAEEDVEHVAAAAAQLNASQLESVSPGEARKPTVTGKNCVMTGPATEPNDFTCTSSDVGT